MGRNPDLRITWVGRRKLEQSRHKTAIAAKFPLTTETRRHGVNTEKTGK